MDWKDILAQKVNSGELEHEEYIPQTTTSTKTADLIEVILDRKGRKGKTATIASGFTCDEIELKSIASKIKTNLSTGGSARGGEILVQGEHVEDVKRLLSELGYRVRK